MVIVIELFEYLHMCHLFLGVDHVKFDLGYCRFLVQKLLFHLIHLMTLQFRLTLQCFDVILISRCSHVMPRLHDEASSWLVEPARPALVELVRRASSSS